MYSFYEAMRHARSQITMIYGKYINTVRNLDFLSVCLSLVAIFVRFLFCLSVFSLAFFFCVWRCCPTRAMASSFTRFLDHTQRLTTFGRTPLDEWSAPRRDLYLTTHNTHKRQTSMLPAGFEPTISAGERPQTYALDRAARFNVGCHFTSLEPFSETFRVLLPILIITHFLSTLFFGSRRHAVCTYMSVLEFSPGTCNVSLFGAV